MQKGVGRGPCSQRSRQVYELARTTLMRGKAPYIGAGKSYGCHVHIHDLSDLFLQFFQAAMDKAEGMWGADAYFLAESGEHCWGDLARSLANIGVTEGYLPRFEMEQLKFEEAKDIAGFESTSWGLNVRCRAMRARKLLAWKPLSPTLDDELPRILKAEWETLQKVKSKTN